MVSVVLVFDKKGSTFLILTGVYVDTNSCYLGETDWATRDRES